MTGELHRPLVVERIGAAGLDFVVEANQAECSALAMRMQVPDVTALTCHFHLVHETGNSIIARGHLVAAVVQTCVVSLEDFAATVEERFVIRFVPDGQESDDPDPEALDELPYSDGVIDLGEAAAEQLALALDPYPRAPGAVLPAAEAEPELHPFTVLSALKRLN
jgi:uncharacterized metal-binding protein YceD (DUF177 family)